MAEPCRYASRSWLSSNGGRFGGLQGLQDNISCFLCRQSRHRKQEMKLLGRLGLPKLLHCATCGTDHCVQITGDIATASQSSQTSGGDRLRCQPYPTAVAAW